jgi:opacity protein-like surface antigen
MKKVSLAFATLLLLPLTTVAQTAPRAEVFGGYGFARTGGIRDSQNRDKNLNGWATSVVFSPLDWFGIEGAISGHYGRGESAVTLPPIPGIPVPTFTTRTSASLYTFTAGPRFSARSDRVTGYGHVLAGAARYRQDLDFSVSYIPEPDPLISATFKQTRFAAIFGGGIDVKVTDRVAVRVVEVDYLLTRFEEPDTSRVQSGLRLSTGIVFSFGRR